MMLRLLHIVVLAALFLAAADVYKIKYESTLQAEKVARLRAEVRREQDMIANLRAEWSKLDRPDRIQELAQRHLPAAGDVARFRVPAPQPEDPLRGRLTLAPGHDRPDEVPGPQRHDKQQDRQGIGGDHPSDAGGPRVFGQAGP